MSDAQQLPFDELVENFEFIDDWEERYRYVIELGRKLPPFPEDARGPGTRVEGCASQVWLAPEVSGGPGARAVISFDGDSDAHIVRGLIYVLRSLFSGQEARVILDIDVDASLASLGLDENLSKQRSNGLRAMVARIQQFARAQMS